MSMDIVRNKDVAAALCAIGGAIHLLALEQLDQYCGNYEYARTVITEEMTYALRDMVKEWYKK